MVHIMGFVSARNGLASQIVLSVRGCSTHEAEKKLQEAFSYKSSLLIKISIINPLRKAHE